MSAQPVVEIRGMSFAYDGTPVLEDVDLTIDEREFVSVVGPNGGGKTTLIKLLLGLLKPTSGTVRVYGTSPVEARRRIGYMPQHTNLDPQFPVRVIDVVLMGRLGAHFGAYRKADRGAATTALGELEIEELARRPFSALSGGQRQRVLIARALAAEPDLLLLDEPTANLDLHVESEFYELLKQLNERLTIVLVSHDFGFVSRYVQTVVCVKRNVIVHPTSEITGEIISEIYGGDMRLVRHDHACAEEGHECLDS